MEEAAAEEAVVQVAAVVVEEEEVVAEEGPARSRLQRRHLLRLHERLLRDEQARHQRLTEPGGPARAMRERSGEAGWASSQSGR